MYQSFHGVDLMWFWSSSQILQLFVAGVYAPPCCTRNGKWATAAATITSMAYAAASTSGVAVSEILVKNG